MSSLLLALSLSIAVLGCVTYGLTRVVKLIVPKAWRQSNRFGKAAMIATPVALGALLGAFALTGLMDLMAFVTAHDTATDIPVTASTVLGMFSGSFAAQIHGIMRSKIKAVAEKES